MFMTIVTIMPISRIALAAWQSVSKRWSNYYPWVIEAIRRLDRGFLRLTRLGYYAIRFPNLSRIARGFEQAITQSLLGVRFGYSFLMFALNFLFEYSF